MRNILLILVLLCSLSAYSQKYIQNEFFGCPWNSRMYKMKESLSSRGYTAVIENERLLTANDVRFGGQEWKFAEFSYFHGNLYMVSFSSNFVRKDEVDTCYLYLCDELEKKYKSYESIYINKRIDEQDLGGLYIEDTTGDYIMLYCSYSRSVGGDMYYYLNLVYVYKTLYKKSKASEVDEL